MKIRPATPDDFTAVKTVLLAGLTKDSTWRNLFTLAARQDGDYMTHLDGALQAAIEPKNKDWLVSVLELTDTDDPSPIIASVAIWDMRPADSDDEPNGSSTFAPNIAPPEHENVYISKLGLFEQATTEARIKFFPKHLDSMFLKVLATHPDHQKYNYATTLIKAGIEVARNKGVVVTALVQPGGYIFCSGIGFKDRGAMTLPNKGWNDDIVVKAMTYNPETEGRRPSLVDSLWSYIRD